MSEGQNNYKIKVEMSVLYDFLSGEECRDDHLRELKKVFNIVMFKHFGKYYEYREDLYQIVILAILEKRVNFDKDRPPYNFIYTIFRNEIGNNLRKMVQLVDCDDIAACRGMGVSGWSTEEELKDALPPTIAKFYKPLVGLGEFNVLRLSRRDALDLILFCRMHKPMRPLQVPEFLDSKKAIPVMYKLLKDLIFHSYEQ